MPGWDGPERSDRSPAISLSSRELVRYMRLLEDGRTSSDGSRSRLLRRWSERLSRFSSERRSSSAAGFPGSNAYSESSSRGWEGDFGLSEIENRSRLRSEEIRFRKRDHGRFTARYIVVSGFVGSQNIKRRRGAAEQGSVSPV